MHRFLGSWIFSCQPVCDAGYSANNALTCVANSALTSVTVVDSPIIGATVFPTATLSGGGGTLGAIAVTAKVFSASVVNAGTSGYAATDTITIAHADVGTETATTDVVLTVASVDSDGKITAVTVTTPGAFTAITDITAVAQTGTSGDGVGIPTFDLSLSILSIAVTTTGTGYTTAPTVALGGAGSSGQSATATMSDALTSPYTVCDATKCAVNHYVKSKVCTACAAGSTNALGDDASGADTACDATKCAVNEYVKSNVCTACTVGTTNTVGDDASGEDTFCDVDAAVKASSASRSDI
jgi:hypothetical protein